MTAFKHLDRLLSRLANVRQQGDGHIACCPAHDDTNPSLSITTTPSGHIRVNCRSAGCSQATILQALGKTPDDLSPDPDDEVIFHDDSQTITVPAEIAPTDPINFDLRNQVYSGLLSSVPLICAHRDDLRRRGLNDVQIEQRVYRSLTFDIRDGLIRDLRSRFRDEELRQVPGLVLNQDGTLSIVGPRSGLLIPVRDANGLVIALKIRRDDTSDGRGKYMYLSGRPGPSCGTPTHVPLGVCGPLDMVRITEGELKSDVATSLSGIPTLGICGTSTWSSALPVLEGLRVQTVRLAFDADYTSKPHVARDLACFGQELASRGYAVSVERWPIENGKGIDELLVNGHQPELLTGPQATEFLTSIHEAQTTSSETIVGVQATAEVPAASTPNETENTVPVPASSPLLPFPIDVFPASLRRFAQQASESLGCPVDLVAIPMLAIAATAIGASRSIELKAGWWESPRFYMAVVAEPGSGKTPAETLICRPVHDIQCRYKREYDQACHEYEAVMAEAEARRRRGRRTDATDDPVVPVTQPSTESDATAASTTAEIPLQSNDPHSPPKPVLTRVTVGDATTESLAPILAKTPRGVIKIMDELSGWVAGMNQYKSGKGTDCQFYLSCWSGANATVDRKSQGEPIIVPHPFLNVLGGIQPDMLSALSQDKNRADGFLDRILFAFPERHPEHGWVNQGVDQESERSWADALGLLFQLQMRHCDERGIDLPQIVHFTDPGKAAFVAWYSAHAAEMDSSALAAVLIGPWAKLKSYCARLALVIQMLRLVCRETAAENVDAESVSRAIQLVDYFKSHAKKVYGRLHHDQDDRRVDQLVTWIRNHGGECCIRDLVRSNAANIKKTTDATKMLKDLVDRGLGQFEDRTGGNGHKVTYFLLN